MKCEIFNIRCAAADKEEDEKTTTKQPNLINMY